MAGDITTTVTYFLQRRIDSGAWTTIKTSSSVVATRDATGSDQTRDTLTTTFSASELDWTNNAQYRIMISNVVADGSDTIDITVVSTRMYSISLG